MDLSLTLRIGTGVLTLSHIPGQMIERRNFTCGPQGKKKRKKERKSLLFGCGFVVFWFGWGFFSPLIPTGTERGLPLGFSTLLTDSEYVISGVEEDQKKISG